MKNEPREAGIAAHDSGAAFNNCPFTGLDEKNIELRWQWQKGWLRGWLDDQDHQHSGSGKGGAVLWNRDGSIRKH